MATLREALDNNTTTENGAPSFKSTGDPLLDFFSLAGALRTGGNDVARAVPLFQAAYARQRADAVAAAFYMRDVRGGQGEREVFRRIWQLLPMMIRASEIAPLIRLIPEYGRWDDLLLLGPNKYIGGHVVEYVRTVFAAEKSAEQLSLLSKYLPSENASSNGTKALADFWMRALYRIPGRNEIPPQIRKEYRKTLSYRRARLNIVERLMSAGQWDKIDYRTVTSKAMFIYHNAFKKHDPERFAAYLAEVKAGSSKINASTMYPYEIIAKLIAHGPSEVMDAMWAALPDYLKKTARNILCICDTSGSMSINDSTPLYVALALTLYGAERSNGIFADTAITFSKDPSFVTIPRELPLLERIRILSKGSGYNTNFLSVFQLVLGTAVRAGVKQQDMPDVIFCLTDMQFDQADGCVQAPHTTQKPTFAKTNFQYIRQMYADAGYEMPRFVLWNVRAAADQPVMMMEEGVYLVSGLSPVIFEHALNLDTSVVTPVDAMLHTLRGERYAPVYKAMNVRL